jgi:hypothetical protein
VGHAAGKPVTIRPLRAAGRTEQAKKGAVVFPFVENRIQTSSLRHISGPSQQAKAGGASALAEGA